MFSEALALPAAVPRHGVTKLTAVLLFGLGFAHLLVEPQVRTALALPAELLQIVRVPRRMAFRRRLRVLALVRKAPEAKVEESHLAFRRWLPKVPVRVKTRPILPEAEVRLVPKAVPKVISLRLRLQLIREGDTLAIGVIGDPICGITGIETAQTRSSSS